MTKDIDVKNPTFEIEEVPTEEEALSSSYTRLSQKSVDFAGRVLDSINLSASKLGEELKKEAIDPLTKEFKGPSISKTIRIQEALLQVVDTLQKSHSKPSGNISITNASTTTTNVLIPASEQPAKVISVEGEEYHSKLLADQNKVNNTIETLLGNKNNKND